MTTICDNLSDISGMLNCLRSGLESSQSKMELVASIEMPTTWAREIGDIQSGASSQAKHGGAYFSAVSGSIKDPIAVPGWHEVPGV